MNQIKYLVNASIIVFLLFLLALTIQKISSLESPDSVISENKNNSPTNTTVVASEGKKLFSSNCATCHSLNKELTGPALRGVEGRGPWSDRKNLIMWVRNPATTMNKFDYTKELVTKFGSLMTPFSHLTDKEIHDIFDYIKNAPSGAMPVAMK